ncbi:uncharacterized protein MYCFIDRAFT_176577 [Pseudocercospora fijiensis CIRAD86]|uniref:Uncharacterized protein n=1 Tax=Pseudocercospora fijiensis (strain CIRAD86) TaxID=383855 RepID=M3A9I5_PSEFD|nr:uncharacterized protein MYCFIDRAFT_176577 [Pseudocercospora fijiensis CIRAD86]EME81281.1 hypothetical protein MYCFIDRAFT_176577 [Pseudocercospora fijiensis CIRAD86]
MAFADESSSSDPFSSLRIPARMSRVSCHLYIVRLIPVPYDTATKILRLRYDRRLSTSGHCFVVHISANGVSVLKPAWSRVKPTQMVKGTICTTYTTGSAALRGDDNHALKSSGSWSCLYVTAADSTIFAINVSNAWLLVPWQRWRICHQAIYDLKATAAGHFIITHSATNQIEHRLYNIYKLAGVCNNMNLIINLQTTPAPPLTSTNQIP